MNNQTEEGGDKNNTEQSKQAEASAAAQAVAFALAQGAFQLAQQQGIVQAPTGGKTRDEDSDKGKSGVLG